MVKKHIQRGRPESISIEYNGKVHTAFYEVKSGIITVTSLIGTMSTHLGSLPPENLARLLLKEMVESKSKSE